MKRWIYGIVVLASIPWIVLLIVVERTATEVLRFVGDTIDSVYVWSHR